MAGIANAETPARRSVLLLKAADAKYEEAFTSVDSAAGGLQFDVHFADVLTFEYVNPVALRHVLVKLADHSALLVTSPRAGIAIRNVIEALDEPLRQQVIDALLQTPVFSVGKATSRELEHYGVQCRGDDCGSADVMAEYIHQDGVLPASAASKPAVFLCGDKHRDALPLSFQQRELPFQELTVYRTCAISDFQLPAACAKPDWIVYFSPSGIKATRGLSTVAFTEIKKAAIGKTTATALDKVVEETGEATWAADVVAPQPNAESLAKAIIDYELAALR